MSDTPESSCQIMSKELELVSLPLDLLRLIVTFCHMDQLQTLLGTNHFFHGFILESKEVFAALVAYVRLSMEAIEDEMQNSSDQEIEACNVQEMMLVTSTVALLWRMLAYHQRLLLLLVAKDTAGTSIIDDKCLALHQTLQKIFEYQMCDELKVPFQRFCIRYLQKIAYSEESEEENAFIEEMVADMNADPNANAVDVDADSDSEVDSDDVDGNENRMTDMEISAAVASDMNSLCYSMMDHLKAQYYSQWSAPNVFEFISNTDLLRVLMAEIELLQISPMNERIAHGRSLCRSLSIDPVAIRLTYLSFLFGTARAMDALTDAHLESVYRTFIIDNNCEERKLYPTNHNNDSSFSSLFLSLSL